MKKEINIKDLITFLNYILDKVDDCYKKECEQSLQRFLKRNGILQESEKYEKSKIL